MHTQCRYILHTGEHMNAHTYLQESILITTMQVQLHGYISMSALAYPYIWTYMRLYTQTGKCILRYAHLHLHTKLRA